VEPRDGDLADSVSDGFEEILQRMVMDRCSRFVGVVSCQKAIPVYSREFPGMDR